MFPSCVSSNSAEDLRTHPVGVRAAHGIAHYSRVQCAVHTQCSTSSYHSHSNCMPTRWWRAGTHARFLVFPTHEIEIGYFKTFALYSLSLSLSLLALYSGKETITAMTAFNVVSSVIVVRIFHPPYFAMTIALSYSNLIYVRAQFHFDTIWL